MRDVPFAHLESNLRRGRLRKEGSTQGTYIEKISGIDHGNYRTWLEEKLLPNTRLIIEPKIEGCPIIIKYEKGYLKNAISKMGAVKTDLICKIKNIPQKIPISSHISIIGQIYSPYNSAVNSKKYSLDYLNNECPSSNCISFLGVQILNVDLNQYSQLQVLHKLGFSIPPNEFTRFWIGEVETFISLWKAKKIFQEIPNNGIVLKVNSRKFQKQLGECKLYPYWAYAISLNDKAFKQGLEHNLPVEQETQFLSHLDHRHHPQNQQ